MTDQDKKRFAACMLGLAENFGETLSKPGLDMRFKALEQFSIEQVERAALAIMRERRWTKMPTVAEFMDHLGEGRLEDRAEVEAAKVLKAIGSVGGYSSVTFDDPVTMAVIELGFGGWVKVCGELNSDKEGWFLKDFARIYQSYSRQGVKRFGHLAGIAETHNAGHSLGHIPRPVLVGDQKKAAMIAADNRRPMLGRGDGPRPVGESVAGLLERAKAMAGNA